MPGSEHYRDAVPKLTYIANPYSVHVGVWLKALAACGIDVRIETAVAPADDSHVGAHVEHLAPRWLRRPSVLRYLWAGAAARFKRRERDEILHAHCTSGNGMVAWMSGHPYVVTTYGSEVLAAAERGWLYRWLIHRVLAGADRITATSPQMVDVLVNQYGIPREQIHQFDLGLDTQTFHPAVPDERRRMRSEIGIGDDEPVWISVKRVIPMNRTIEIVDAFCRYCDTHESGRLIVICGDDISNYSHRVKQLVASTSHAERIIVLAEWLTPEGVARWLQIADYAISVPTSDQMSNAVLEAMACGTVPILLNIDGYRLLREWGADVRWLDVCTVDSLAAAFETAARVPDQQRHSDRQAGVDFVHRHYSNRKVCEVLQRLYNLPTPTFEVSRHAA